MKFQGLIWVFAIGFAASTYADPVDPEPSITRNWMPNRCEQRNSFGDPIVTAAQSMFSSRWDDDVSVDTPQGRFTITRIYAGDRRAFGQVSNEVIQPECRAPVIGRLTPGFLKSPYGGNFWSVNRQNALLQTNSLMSLVDTRCPDVTRVLTPGGDTRFFGEIPALSNNQTAWVPRVPFANGEVSRLKVGKNSSGVLWFEWYSESGQKLEYQSPGTATKQYVLVAEFNTDGSLFYNINWGYPAPAQVALPAALSIPERPQVSCPNSCLDENHTGPVPPAASLPRCTLDGTCTAGLSCPSSAPSGCDVGLANLVCIDTQWDSRHCGACNSPCAAGQYCRTGTCTAKPNPCDMSPMPVSVTFPNTALYLELTYGNPAPSTSPVYYSPECLLTQVDAVSFSNREHLVRYDYAMPTAVGGFLVSRFDKAVFAQEGGPNAWTRLIRGDDGSGPYHTTSWALGITETRLWPGGIATPAGNGEDPSFAGNIELIATHKYPREAGAASLMMLEQGASSELFAKIGAPAFVSTGCTNCCSSRTFVRPVRVAGSEASVNGGGGKLVQMSYFGFREANGTLSEWNGGSSMLSNDRAEICLSSGDECQSSTESYFYGRVGSGGSAPQLLACSASNQPVAQLAQQNKNGAFSQFDVSFNSTEQRQEINRIALGATDTSGTDALYRESSGYGYVNAVQTLDFKSQESVLAASEEAATFYRRSGGRVTAVIRRGVTLQGGGRETKFIGTFFVREKRPCSTAKSNGGVVVAVLGPCYVQDENATTCLNSETTGGGLAVAHDIPLTEFFYYGDDDLPSVVTQPNGFAFNSGRVALVRKYPHYPATCADGIDTVYGSYDGFGNAGIMLDANGRQTTIERTGGLATLIRLATGDEYHLDYDRGRVTRLTRPEADATVICTQPSVFLTPTDPQCWRTAMGQTGPSGGAGGAGYTPPLQANGGLFAEPSWIADVSPPPALKTVRVDRFSRTRSDTGTVVNRYTHGSIGLGFNYNFMECIDDPYYIADQKCEGLRTTAFDFEGRLKSASSGNNAASFTSSRFDVNSNLVALGSGVDFADTGSAEAFCRSSGSDDPRCTLFSYDRLNRLSGTWWRGTLSEDCVAYDAQGNISVIARGCFNDGQTYGSVCGGSAPTVTNGFEVEGGPACGERLEYIWDDFGRLVATNRPSGNGVARTRYEYDLTGNLLKKQTSLQASVGEVSWTKRDGLGRLVETSISSAGNGSVSLTARQWDDAIAAPAQCLASFPALNQRNLKGRIGYTHDPVWDTWYAYDALGRLTDERRVRSDVLETNQTCSGGGGDGNTQAYYNTTRYTYTPNGNISTIRYPSGRLIRYL